MGSQKKHTISAKPLNNYPGPGRYGEKKNGKGKSFGFGTGKRMLVKRDSSPGPGSYKIPTKIRDLQNYTLSKNEFSYV